MRLMAGSRPPQAAVPSPFYHRSFLRSHFVLAGLAAFFILSTGVVFSAENSLPTEQFFALRVNVIEPLAIFLAPTQDSKNDLRIRFLENGLQDFSEVSLKDSIAPEDQVQFTDAFSSKVADVHREILKLASDQDLPNALETANNLQSVLSAQNIVLNKVRQSNPAATGAADLSQTVGQSIQETGKIINSLTENLQASDNSAEIDETITAQKKEIDASLDDIQDLTQKSAEDTDGTLDSEDQSYLAAQLSDVNAVVHAGDQKSVEGDKTQAVVLYNQADQKLGELQSLLGSDSDSSLGIDVLGQSGDAAASGDSAPPASDN